MLVSASAGKPGDARAARRTPRIVPRLCERQSGCAEANPKTGERRSYRQIAKMLKDMGHLNERGAEFNAQSIKNMVDGPMPSGDGTAD